VYLGAFRREALEEVGGWAEDVGVNEDYELNYRIRRAGGRVHYEPDIEVGYRPRTSFRALAKQYVRYGRSKATVARRHPASVRARQAAPALLGVVGVAALLPGRWGRRARRVAALHAATVGVLAAREPGQPGEVRLRLAAAALVMHWGWAAGFLAGLVRPFPPAR
jgi:GT2 family glycosyltransferase